MKRPSRSFLKRAACLLEVALLIFIAVVLEGCGIEDARRNAFWRSKDIPRIDGYLGIVNIRVPEHSQPFWRAAREYWDKFAYKEPETGQRKFLSCMDKKVNGLEVCSGQGACMPWDPEDMANPLFFCKCGKAYAGPECNFKRKSQAWAWFYSLLFGYTGADMFYLGFPYYGTWKLMYSIGAACLAFANTKFGIPALAAWWLWDVVRIGSAPIYAHDYRVSPDLPRWAFACFAFLFMSILGYCAAVVAIYNVVTQKRRKIDEAIIWGAKVL